MLERAARGGARLAACSGSSTAPPPSGASEGQLRRRLALPRRRGDRRLGRRARASVYLPALERLLPRRARRARARLRGHPLAAGHLPGRARHAPPSARDRHARCRGLYLAGAWTDTGWPPTMEGAVRSGLSAAARRSPPRGAAPPRRAKATSEGGRRDGHHRPHHRRRPGERSARTHAPALAAAAGRLLEGRARDERDDRRRGSLPRATSSGSRATARDRGDARAGSAPRSAPDGSWATFHGGPGDLSTTRRGLRRAAPRRRPGRRRAHARARPTFVREAGGVEATPRLHAHVALAARPLVVGAGADAAARADPAAAAGAALGLLVRLLGAPDDRRALGRDGAARPSVARRLRRSTSCAPAPSPRQAPDDLWGRAFVARSTAAAHLYGRHAAAAAAPRARCARAERWIVERQERDGSWGGIQPPWVWSIVALRALGYPLDHPVLARALAGLDTFTIDDETRPPHRGLPVAGLGHRARACSRCSTRACPPATRRSRRAGGLARPRRRSTRAETGRCAGPSSRRAASRSSSRTTTTPTSTTPPWSCSRCAAAASTTAGPPTAASAGCSACRAARAAGAPSTSTTRAGSAPSSPSATSARSPTRRAPTSPRTCSRRSPTRGAPASGRATRRSTGCSPAQERTAPGSAAGARTTSTAPARCCRRSPPAGSPTTRASPPAVRFLERVQNADGGFGEDLRSYRDRSWSGRGVSTASQTAWALLGLHAGRRRRRAGRRGRGALPRRDASAATAAGTSPTTPGTGFPGDFYLNYHLYRDVFPVMALGRILGGAPMSERAARARPAADRAARARRRPSGMRVLRTGMGPRAPRAAAAKAPGLDAAARRDRGPLRGHRPAPRARRRRLRDRAASPTTASRSPSPGARSLAAALARRGLRVHVGPLASSEPARGARASGALRSRRGARARHGVGLACAGRCRPPARGRARRRRRGRPPASPTRASRSPGCGRCAACAATRAALAEWAAAVGPRTRSARGAALFLRRGRACDRHRRARARPARRTRLRAQADRPQRSRRRRAGAARGRLRRGAHGSAGRARRSSSRRTASRPRYAAARAGASSR